MRITIIDTQARIVTQIVENFDLNELSDFLAQYLDASFVWCVTPAGVMPEHFPHNRYGQYAL